MDLESGKTNAEIYLGLFTEHQPATVYDIMEVISMQAEAGEINDIQKFRLIQGAHGFANQAVKRGKLIHSGTKINPDTGMEVWVYSVPKSSVEPEPLIKTNKGYKQRYEDLHARFEKLEEHLSSLQAFNRCLARERDDARRDLAALRAA